MTKTHFFCCACFAIVVSGSSAVSADDTIAKKTLELFPQADTNGDGVLSSKEEAAVSRIALKRFPNADADGDGVLTDTEKRQLLRQAEARLKRNSNPQRPSPVAPGIDEKNNSKTPSFENVKYGEHERQVLDLWLADASDPTPLAIYIHGGGFTAGSKEKLSPDVLSSLLKAGISVAAINYRYSTIAPLPAAHHDARRALQFLRLNADKWNIDKDRVAAFGGSAGAQISMWLAFTDEMANPESSDPIERESSRLMCVATAGGQTTMDLDFWEEQMRPILGDTLKLEDVLGGGEEREKSEQRRLALWGSRTMDELAEKVKAASALSLISEDDPPIFMSYGMSPTAKVPSDPKRVRGWLIHHVFFGIALKEKADQLHVEADLKYPGSTTSYTSQTEFISEKLLEE